MTAPLPIITDRLELAPLALDDAPFVLELLNTPGFLRFIGDKGVRDLDGARRYLAEGPLVSYARHGFGLLRVALRPDGTPIGICGLIRRPGLDDVDLGFALLPAFERKGYAAEAARATLERGREAHGLRRVVAITDPGNSASVRLLERLGFAFERRIELHGEELLLLGREL